MYFCRFSAPPVNGRVLTEEERVRQMRMARRNGSKPIFLVSITLLLFSFTFTRGSEEKTQIDRIRGGARSLRNSTTHNRTSYSNASSLLADLLADYDIRLRPGFGGDALLLTMDIIIASFDSISEVNMDYTITMYLHQYWTDERLAWSSSVPIDEMTLSGEFSQNIWVPDTFLANDKQSFLHEVTERNKMLRISSDGKIAYGMRLTSTLSCSMNLRNFPLDAQNCTVEIESYGYTTSEVLMLWNRPKAVHGVEEADVPQFTITGYQTEDRVVSTATGSYQRLSLVFQLQRSVGYFIFQTYLPCVLIVMLSWVSFWINHEATSARVALVKCITTVLTMTTISTGVRQSLPRISYVKSIDVYLVMCFVFVFAALLEYAAVNYSYWGRRARGGGEEGWPVSNSNKDDHESAVNIKDWGVPSNIMNELKQSSSDPRTQDINSSGAPLSAAARRGKRQSSPIPSLCPSGPNGIDDDDSPEYPRYSSTVQGMRARQSFSARTRRRLRTTRLRAQSMSLSIQRMGVRARKALPRIRVRDVNVIDKYSRTIFPICFVVFNISYWGYYSLIQL
ncbi:Gamma-aminobutyric acid receptor subunit beta [Trichostrongylus colubriformis]|uniref:Gamma-aminobutyric acid receptor subunit beta n=1 Tax=Trichostrongylus colubriformis TaxID=6319 RepID=A0AAN8FA72_TRICO